MGGHPTTTESVVAHMIEEAKSGRASCRTCKKTITKGELRLGEEVVNAFSSSGEAAFQWHHVLCAAKKKPLALEEALKTTTLAIPNRAELEAEIAENRKKVKPSTYPYAERASTGRSTCLVCSEAIAKGELRVAIERDVDTGSFVTKGAGYLHASCANASAFGSVSRRRRARRCPDERVLRKGELNAACAWP